MTLIELAIAFVARHPAVTAPIIGPRTMEHLESSSLPPTSSSTRRCSTASTTSSRPAPTSTLTTPAGKTRGWVGGAAALKTCGAREEVGI